MRYTISTSVATSFEFCPMRKNLFSKENDSKIWTSYSNVSRKIAPRENCPPRKIVPSTSYFSRLQLKSKKWFTSIYFLQILTKPGRITLIREHLSLNTSLIFLRQNAKKKKRLIRKKNTKKLNNNNIIRVWYLYSKWPVFRFIVNQNAGGTSRTKLSTLLKTNTFKYCALFCNNVVKIHLQ